MVRSQYLSRRKWSIIPEGTLTVLWWKIDGGTVTFVEYLADEPKRERDQQEKDFRESMKGYGKVLQRREMTTAELDKGR